MSKYCRICRNSNCNNHGRDITFIGDGWNCNYIPVPTNADHIRNMSDNELAEIIPCPMNISNFQCPVSTSITCKECKQQWLLRPADRDRSE